MNFPTRADATLDLILTNIQDHYDESTQLPPLARSDHNSIVLTPKQFVAPKGVEVFLDVNSTTPIYLGYIIV